MVISGDANTDLVIGGIAALSIKIIWDWLKNGRQPGANDQAKIDKILEIVDARDEDGAPLVYTKHFLYRDVSCIKRKVADIEREVQKCSK